MEQDEIVYQSGDIIISKTLARFGGVTYPVNGIGSVYQVVTNKPTSPQARTTSFRLKLRLNAQ
jgi:hypothetical protein